MNNYEATERAYKNGYEQGKKDALQENAEKLRNSYTVQEIEALQNEAYDLGVESVLHNRFGLSWHDAERVRKVVAQIQTASQWIPVSEPPKENGYYLCVILFNKKEYRRKVLFWEDNVWIEMANCFRTVKPLYWMPMAEMPEPPKGE